MKIKRRQNSPLETLRISDGGLASEHLPFLARTSLGKKKNNLTGAEGVDVCGETG